MMRSHRLAVIALALAFCAFVAGCSHIPQPHWPWHRPPPPPQVVHELVIVSAEGGQAVDLPQFWKDNTLFVVLQAAGSSGSLVLRPREHTLWPVRIGFRMSPGQFGALEVRARQRLVLPITTAGTKPVDLELPPGVFVMKTPEMTVSWGPAVQSSGD